MSEKATESTVHLPRLSWLGLIHEGLPCKRKDLDACIKFYIDVFDLKMVARPDKVFDQILGYSPSGAWLANEAKTVKFDLIAKDDELSPSADAPLSPTARHTAWLVENLDAVCERLRRHQVIFKRVGGAVASDQVFVNDPSGNTWEFQEPV